MMKLVFIIIGLVYVALICLTILCMVIEHIVIKKMHRLLKPFGIGYLIAFADATLWKKLIMAPFVAWLLHRFVKSMQETRNYYIHLKSLPEDQRETDYKREVNRRIFGELAGIIIKPGDEGWTDTSTYTGDGPF